MSMGHLGVFHLQPTTGVISKPQARLRLRMTRSGCCGCTWTAVVPGSVWLTSVSTCPAGAVAQDDTPFAAGLPSRTPCVELLFLSLTTRAGALPLRSSWLLGFQLRSKGGIRGSV